MPEDNLNSPIEIDYDGDGILIMSCLIFPLMEDMKWVDSSFWFGWENFGR